MEPVNLQDVEFFVFVDSDVEDSEIEVLAHKLKNSKKGKLIKTKEQLVKYSEIPDSACASSKTDDPDNVSSSSSFSECETRTSRSIKGRKDEMETNKKRKRCPMDSLRHCMTKKLRKSENEEGQKKKYKRNVVVEDAGSDCEQKNLATEACTAPIHHTSLQNISVSTEGSISQTVNSSQMQNLQNYTGKSRISMFTQKSEYENRVPANGYTFTQCFGNKYEKFSREKKRRLYTSKVQCLTNCKSCSTYTFPVLSDQEMVEMANYVSMDCEFVGIGLNKTSALGRCSIVDYRGQVIFDRFVKPQEPVTDYRTPWSGLRPQNIQCGIPFLSAREQIAALLENKVVVGHAVYNDFKVLQLTHPPYMIRDTAGCKKLREMAELGSNVCALRKLTQALLGRTIQNGEHCSITDARAALDLFRLVRTIWEPVLKAKFDRRQARVNAQEDHSDVILLKSYLDDHYWPPELSAE